jgi:hypothetical protein
MNTEIPLCFVVLFWTSSRAISVPPRFSTSGSAVVASPFRKGGLIPSGNQFGNGPMIEHVAVDEITSDPMIDFNIALTTESPEARDVITSLSVEDLHIDVNLGTILSTDAYIITPPPRVCDTAYGPGAKLFKCATPLPAVTIV